MRKILEDVSVVPGVSGCFVCDPQGVVVDRFLPPIYDDEMVEQAAHLVGWISEGLQTTADLEAADLVFEQGRLVLRAVNGGFLCILCVPEVNTSLLAMTLNVAERKLGELLSKAPTSGPAPSTRLRQLEALIRLELGDHGEKALEMLADVEDDTTALSKVCARIEKMTRLFVDKKKARDLADSMAAIVRG